jgi:hypothetical protein
VLARHDADETNIMRTLGMDPHDPRNLHAVLDVLGALVREGFVERGSVNDYRLVSPRLK